jgi:hypothetical protein
MAAWIQADRHELGQSLAFPDHPERTVLGVHQPNGSLDDPLQRRLQVQAGTDRHDRLEQAAYPVPGGQDHLHARLQLRKQLVQLKLREHRWMARWPTRLPAGRGRSQVPFG